MAEDVKNITMSMSDLAEMMGKTYSKSDDLRSAFDKMVKAGKTLQDAIKNNSKEVDKYKKELEKAKEELKSTTKATEDANKALKESQKEWETSARGAKKYLDGLKGLGGGLSSVASGVGKYTALLGAQAFTVDNMLKKTLAYNKSMFQFSRTQQVAGNGMSDFGSALENVRKNTVLSDNAFIDMADSTSKMFVGIKPTSTEMANMAKMLQSQFGPNVDVIAEKFKNLAGIQSQFPSLYKRIKEAMELVGKAKSGDKEAEARLQRERTGIKIALQARGVQQDAIESVMQGLVKTTSEQDKFNKLQESTAKVHKNSENAALHAGQAMEGAMIKAADAAGKLYEWLDKIAPVAGTIAVSFAALDIAMSFLPAIKGVKNMIGLLGTGKDAAGKLATSVKGIGGAAEGAVGSVGKIGGALKFVGSAAAIAGAAFAGWELGKFLDDLIGISDWVGRLAGKKVDVGFMAETGDADIAKATKTYGDAFVQKFKELGGEQAKGVQKFGIYQKALKEMRKETVKISSDQKKSNEEIETMVGNYQSIVNELNSQLSVIGQVNQALQEQINISESFGLVNKEAWETYLGSAKNALAQTQIATAGIVKDVQKNLKDLNINVDFGDAVSDANKLVAIVKALTVERDKLTTQDKLDETQKNRLADINDTLVILTKQQTENQKASASVIRAGFDIKLAEVKQMEDITSLTEQRLSTERQLMESAQFGLGASVEMMQKQVDLAHKMAKEYEKGDVQIRKEAASQSGVNEKIVEQVGEMGSASEAQERINSLVGKNTPQAEALMKYYMEHQKLKTKEMQQQQKIYDLTKSIREGYLDAMREMSVGAGEFEKIIGTQEMGVSQLMTAVKDTTGSFKTNTFKLGGMQSTEATSAGVGAQVTGQMTTSGLKFIGGAEQERRNQRIYQYNASTTNVAGVQGGAVSAVAPRVGSAVQPQFQDVYSGAFRDPGYTTPLANAQNVVNVGVGQQAFNVGEISRMRATGRTSGVLGHEYLDRAPAPVPATGGFVPGIGTMPTPRQAGLEGPSQATVIIKLGPEIQGELDQVSNLKVQLDHAVR